MSTKLIAKLEAKMQEFLDDPEVADELGGTYGVWQDTTTEQRNAVLMAKGAWLVVEAMSLQGELEQENRDA